jgi:cellulose synthase (UDP-forming)
VSVDLSFSKRGRVSGASLESTAPESVPPIAPSDQDHPYLVPLFSRRQKFQYLALVSVWLLALVYFWSWWFVPDHNIGTLRYVLNTVVVGWITVLPLYFVAICYHSRVADPGRPVPEGLRAAMVVTKAPSEPFDVVRHTLRAMLNQTYAHDTWLADEDPTPEVIDWCERHGVRISTRKNRPDYHRPTWPRRTRCKEGNLAFFYDMYGYDNYDFVVQLDADHVPEPSYLEEMLRPFADPEVGYVSAPSICDRNASDSWTARGRLYFEATLHGPMQAGYTGGMAPLCIGSHYGVRTQALKEIGGLGPDLAEDHSTTLLMNAHGWRGVHAIDAIAHGDGPRTFADFAIQEFQWSRSLMTILLCHTPNYIGRLPRRLQFQFLFCQLWYPLFFGMMLVMYTMPLAALLLDANMVGIIYPEFFVRFSLIALIMVVLVSWWKAQGWTRPVDTQVLSWEGILFLFARWPWAILGVAAAVRDRVTGTTADFRVTPKGRDATDPLPLRLLAPYAALSLLSGVPVLLIDSVDVAKGFYVFAALNSALYALLLWVTVRQHERENPVNRGAAEAAGPGAPGMANRFAATVMMVTALSVGVVGTQQAVRGGGSALVWGAECLVRDCGDPPSRSGTSEYQPSFLYTR